MATDPRIRYDIAATASGAAEVEKLAREFEQLDGAFPEDLAGKVRQASQQLEQLGQQQAAVEAFSRIKTETEQARRALDDAQAAAQKFGAELAQVEAPTRAQAGQLQKLRDNVRDAKDELLKQTQALDAARAGLTQFGISGDQVGQRSVALRQQISAVRSEIEQLGTTGRGAAGFQQLVRETDAARQRMEQTAQAAEALAAELARVQRPTDGQTASLRQLQAAAGTARADFVRLQAATVEQGVALRQAGANTELLTARARESAAAQTQAATAAQKVTSAYSAQGAAAARAAQQQNEAARSVRQGLEGIATQLRNIQTIAGTVLGGQLLSGTLGDVARTADAYANLEARIKLVTGEGAALQQAFAGVFDVALRTNTALEGTGTLFARIAQANRDLGLSSAESTAQALALTETINQAIQVSGGSAQAADAAITQLIQGLQSGVLRGEEFNSVMEQAPRLARALADGLGVTTGELRKLAEQGKLTSQTVIQALQGQSAALKREFEALPATVSRALTNLSTEWTKFIGELDRSSGASSLVAEGINKIAANLDTIARVAAVAGAALTASLGVKAVQALRALSIEAAAASKSASILTASLANIPSTIKIGISAVGFEVGFQIGDMLYQNSELARKLGVGLVAFFENIINDLKLLRDAGSAIFTSDTIEAAFDRFRERGRQLDETFSQMWKDAEQLPITYASATDKAGASTEALAARGEAAAGRLSGAAGSAAGAVGGIGKQANTAEGALLAIGNAAGISLPTIGVTANQQAAAMVNLLLKSQQTADVFERELPDAIAKLSGPELAAFVAALSAALAGAETEARKTAAGLEAVGKDGAPKIAEAERATKLLKDVVSQTGEQAAQSLGVDVVAASTQVSAAFQKSSDSLSVLIRSLPELKAAGVDTGTVVAQALGNMISAAKNQAEIDLVIARLQALAGQGVITGEQLRAALQLGTDKAKELKEKVDEATPGIGGLAEAARKAGVDVGLLTTGVSEGFAKGVKEVTDLGIEIEKAGIGAQRASPLLAEALDKRLQTAQTKEEVELLRKEAERLGASGKLAGNDFTEALEKIKAKAKEVSPEIKQLQKDAQKLGLDLKDSTNKGVEESIRAYERLKESGQFTTGALKQAFIDVAKKAIEAAGGQIPEWVKVEAAIRGVTVGTDEAGNAVIEYGNKAEGAFAKAKAGAESVVGSLGKVKKAAEEAEKSLSVLGKNTYDKDGFATDSNGNRINITGQIPLGEGQSIDVQAFLRAQQSAALSGQAAPDPKNFVVTDPGQVVRDPASIYGQYQNSPGAGGAGYSPFSPQTQQQKKGSSAPATRFASPSPTTVNININGQQAGSVNVMSPNDAKVLEDAIRQLTIGQRSTGQGAGGY